jgi:hypothetical protein
MTRKVAAARLMRIAKALDDLTNRMDWGDASFPDDATAAHPGALVDQTMSNAVAAIRDVAALVLIPKGPVPWTTPGGDPS